MKIFSNLQCKLGEAPLWHPQRQSLFWIDIIEQTLFEKKLHSSKPDYDQMWKLNVIVSGMSCKLNSPDELWVVTHIGLVLLNLSTGQYSIKAKLDLPEGFRTNDAHVSSDGAFWVGTMQESPTGTKGSLYRITQDYRVKEILNESIGIPNTLCWSTDGSKFYLSDSLLQKMFIFDFPIDIENIRKKIFIDLSHGHSTPDGGAVDTSGGLWNAQWDGYCVVRYNDNGNETSRLTLPIPRPTSCCFGGETNQLLFITSASDGLSSTELAQHPHSGNVFMYKIDSHKGTPVHSFKGT